MEGYELVNRIHKQFYQNFTINKERQFFDVQSKLLTSAIFCIIMEKAFGKEHTEFKKAKLSICSTIDKEIYHSQELMGRARITEATKQFPFAFMQVDKIKRKLEAVNHAIEEGSLANVVSDFSELLYLTYVKPMSKYDEDHYMECHPLEVLRLKPIFLKDYSSFKKIVISELVEKQIIEKIKV